MPHKNDPVLKIDALRERKLISAINCLLGRSNSYRWDMPHWVKIISPITKILATQNLKNHRRNTNEKTKVCNKYSTKERR